MSRASVHTHKNLNNLNTRHFRATCTFGSGQAKLCTPYQCLTPVLVMQFNSLFIYVLTQQPNGQL
jgi:hypothetical protein